MKPSISTKLFLAVLADGCYAKRASISAMDKVEQRKEPVRFEFMSDVYHELRTRLAILRSTLEVSKDGLHAAYDDVQQSLQAEVSMLSKLVGGLYELPPADVKQRMDLLGLLLWSVANTAPAIGGLRP